MDDYILYNKKKKRHWRKTNPNTWEVYKIPQNKTKTRAKAIIKHSTKSINMLCNRCKKNYLFIF